jgi:predicted amidohydrolase
VGHSRSVDAAGAILAEAASEEETLLVVPIGTAGARDERVDYLRQLPHDLDVVGCER